MKIVKELKQCNGNIYRCRVSLYQGKKGEVVNHIKMVPMKKLSCPGCEKCYGIKDQISDFISCSPEAIAFPEFSEDGKLYRLEITNISHDYESGQVDDWDLEFVKVEERKAQDKEWGGPKHDDKHSSHDWVAYIVKHLGRAVQWPRNIQVFRKQMITVAALAVAAIEWCDRQEKK